jgi:hypothetical protein
MTQDITTTMQYIKMEILMSREDIMLPLLHLQLRAKWTSKIMKNNI